MVNTNDLTEELVALLKKYDIAGDRDVGGAGCWMAGTCAYKVFGDRIMEMYTGKNLTDEDVYSLFRELIRPGRKIGDTIQRMLKEMIPRYTPKPVAPKRCLVK